METVLLVFTAILSALSALLGAVNFFRRGERAPREEFSDVPAEPEESQGDRALLEGICNLLSYQVGERKEEG